MMLQNGQMAQSSAWDGKWKRSSDHGEVPFSRTEPILITVPFVSNDICPKTIYTSWIPRPLCIILVPETENSAREVCGVCTSQYALPKLRAVGVEVAMV